MGLDPLRLQALNDFEKARRDAALQGILDRLQGRSSALLSFDEVHQKFGGIQDSERKLKDIPTGAIVGSVGRYNDFNRDFLPTAPSDRERWAGVKAAVESRAVLPPIQVYQVGQTYFVIDGNHRVSIARLRGEDTIPAYVTEIKTRVELTPDDSPQDLIRKAELNDFLEATGLQESAPEADFRVTEFGVCALFLQQIEMVAYDLTRRRGAEVDFAEAALGWYREHYLPAVEVIREQNLLRHYPARTEADLYSWLLENRQALSSELGWDLQLESVAAELAARKMAEKRLKDRLRTVLGTEDGTGGWRQRHLADTRGKLFADIVVLLEDESLSGHALEHALAVAAHEDAHLLGLLLRPAPPVGDPGWKALQRAYEARCGRTGISGQLAAGSGKPADVLEARTRWADLAVLPPPAPGETVKAYREILNSIHIPVWIAAGPARLEEGRLLLAFDGSPKSHEALFLTAYLAGLWDMRVTIITVLEPGVGEDVQDQANSYLQAYNLEARSLQGQPPAAGAILSAVGSESADLLVIGGYRSRVFGRPSAGRTLDAILRQAAVPLLLCR